MSDLVNRLRDLIKKLRDHDLHYSEQEAAADALERLTQPTPLPDGQAHCYCGTDFSLQIVSGGAAAEGLYGHITCRLPDGSYQGYVKSGDPKSGCVCGEPKAPSTTHRTDGPCFLTQPGGDVEHFFLLFDCKDPSHPVFVEAETQDGIGVNIAAWNERADGLHELGPVCSAATVARLIAERDAALTECARLKTVPMKYRRMAFNAQLQDENAALQERVKTLQNAMDKVKMTCREEEYLILRDALEAIAATEPKEKTE